MRMDKLTSRFQQALSDAQSLAVGTDLELYASLAERREAWLSEVERRFVADSIEADRTEKKRREASPRR